MGAGFSQLGEFFIAPSGLFALGGAGGLHKADFNPGLILPFGPTVDLNFAAGQYFGVSGAPTNFLTTVRAAPAAWAVNASGNWASFAANTPRITNLGLLVEESRQNLVINNYFQGGWAINLTTLATGITSPDGAAHAGSITDNATSGQHYVYNSSGGVTTVAGTTYAFSAFFKQGTGQFAAVSFATGGFASGFYACVNLATGAVTTSGAAGVGTFTAAYVQMYPNGWVRLTAVGTPGSTGPTFPILSIIQNAAGTPTTNYAGSGSTIQVWVPQAEVGSFATSPIPTTSAAVTRAADVVTLTSPPAFGASYSMFASGAPQAPTSYASNQMLMNISDGTTTNRSTFVRAAGSGASSQATVGTAGTIANFAWNGSATNLTLPTNVLAKAAQSLTGASGMTTVNIGDRPDGALQWNGTLARIALWPTTALSAAQLQAITT